jgi:hypothetical protein
VTHARHIQNLAVNIQDVYSLINIHVRIGGDRPGRRRGLQVLNKSAIVLLTACWEAYIEDLADNAFEFLLSKCKRYKRFPCRVRVLASNWLKKDSDESRIWDLAGFGWKNVLRDHKRRHLTNFNTPRSKQIDDLFETLLGLKHLSSKWQWRRVSARNARLKLDRFISLRGEIAHRVSTPASITMPKVREYLEFVYRLAVHSTNAVRSHLYKLTKSYPWQSYEYRQSA